MTSPRFITRFVATAPTPGLGYRVRFAAAASQEAASFRAAQERRAGFPAEVLEVDRDTWALALRGDLNTYQQEPGL